MGRILAISDVHENIDMLNKILFSGISFDAVFLVGDIAELRIPELYNLLRVVDKDIVIVNGNHDCVLCLSKISKKLQHVHYIQRGVLEVEISGETYLVGVLGGIYRKRRADGVIYFDDKILIRFFRGLRKYESLDFMLTHVPPYHRADFLPRGGRGGLKAFLICEDMCNPKFWIAGHTHVLAVERMNNGFAVNCGLGYIGDFALIDTKKRSVVVGRYIDKDNIVFDIDNDASWDYIYYLRKTKSFKRIVQELSKKI